MICLYCLYFLYLQCVFLKIMNMKKFFSKILEYIDTLAFKLIFFGLILIFLFHENIIRFIDSVFVIPIVGQAGKTIKEYPITFLIITILILIVFIIKIYYFFDKRITNEKKNNIKFTKHINLTFANDLIFIIYILIRLFEYPWDFTPIYCFENISYLENLKYLDIIAAINLAYTIICFIKTNELNTLRTFPYVISHLRKKKDDNIDKGFKVDSEIYKVKDDILGRKEFAKQIVSLVEDKEKNENSLAIGICGDWGSGKSSFLNLLEFYFCNEKKYKKKKNAPIIIKLKPWLNGKESAITQELLNSLASELNKYDKNITPLIRKYITILTSAKYKPINYFLKPIETILNAPKTAEKQYTELKKKIENINREIIVFIDDLDRLYPKEIYQTIKLIRNSVNFRNITYIAAYEKNYLLKALGELKIHNHHLFLEKIFQVEFELPEYENNNIEKELENRLKLFFKERKISLMLFIEYFTYHIKTIKTIRDVTRFYNSFLISYNNLKKHALVLDLLLLESIRFKYPTVCKLLYEKYIDILDYDRINLYSLKEKVNKTLPKQMINWKTKSVEKKSFEIEDILKSELNLKDNEIDEILDILKILFKKEEEKNYLSIKSPFRFHLYFHYNILSYNFLIEEIIKARDNDLNKKSDESELMKVTHKNNLKKSNKDLLFYLHRTVYYNVEDYKNVITVYLYNQANDKKLTDFINTKLLKKDIIFKDKNEQKVVVKELINKFSFNSYISKIIYDIRINKMNTKTILTNEELEEINLNYLKAYLEKNKNDFSILYFWNFSISCNTVEGTKHKKAIKIIKQFIENNEYLFFTNSIFYYEIDNSNTQKIAPKFREEWIFSASTRNIKNLASNIKNPNFSIEGKKFNIIIEKIYPEGIKENIRELKNLFTDHKNVKDQIIYEFLDKLEKNGNQPIEFEKLKTIFAEKK